jgi:hypothetical protein
MDQQWTSWDHQWVSIGSSMDIMVYHLDQQWDHQWISNGSSWDHQWVSIGSAMGSSMDH